MGADPSLGVPLADPVAIGILAIAGLIWFRFLRPFEVRRAIAYDVEQRWPEYQDEYRDQNEAAREWWLLLEAWGDLVFAETRRSGETLPEFGERLLGKRRWRWRRIKKPPPLA